MSAQLKEALAALDAAQGRFGQVGWFNVIRDALELAARESEAQSAVNAWLDADDDRYQSSGRQYSAGYYFTLYPNQMRDERRAFYGEDRLDALEAAAEWCRAEMAKT